MTVKIFKTKKLAMEYIRENYGENPNTKSSGFTDRSDWEAIDMPNYSWSGDDFALEIRDDNYEPIDCVSWHDSGDEVFELFVGGESKGKFDNTYDAYEAYRDARKEQEYEDEPKEVIVLVNGERAFD